jgi:hypothetical protein
MYRMHRMGIHRHETGFFLPPFCLFTLLGDLVEETLASDGGDEVVKHEQLHLGVSVRVCITSSRRLAFFCVSRVSVPMCGSRVMLSNSSRRGLTFGSSG